MLVDKLKEVQLVTESKALKLDAINKTFQRFDRTVYVEEPFTIPVTGTGEVYVEAQKFFALLTDTIKIDIQNDFVKLTLNNNAEYKLPKMDLSWSTNVLTKKFDIAKAINLKLATGRLTSATLKNLANPMLQCIYIDQDTGVSCNSMVACIDGTTVSDKPVLIPPDVVLLMEGREAQVSVVDSNFIIKIGEAYVICPIPEYDYSETATVLRSSLPENITKYPVGQLFDEIKRLSAFGEFLVFNKDRVSVGENFEPFDLPTAEPTFSYNVQYLLTALPQVSHIAQSEFALLLYGDKYLFMVSPEQAPEVKQGE